VNVAAEARIEEQVPAGMAVVVIHLDAVAIQLPIAAAMSVVGRNHPIGLVVENDMSRARVEAANDNDFTDVWITAVLVPTFVFAVVVVVALVIIVIAVLVPALVFAVVIVLRTGPGSRGEGEHERGKRQQGK